MRRRRLRALFAGLLIGSAVLPLVAMGAAAQTTVPPKPAVTAPPPAPSVAPSTPTAVPATLPAVGTSAPAPPLSAALTIRRIDTTAFPVVTADVQATATNAAVGVRDGNRPAANASLVNLKATTLQVGTVLVIDTAASMLGTKFDLARQAAQSYISHRLPNESIAIVSTGDVARVVVNFTKDPAQLAFALSQLTIEGELATFDGMRAGASLFDGHPDWLANMVVIADRNDTFSKTKEPDAYAAVAGAKAAVFFIALPYTVPYDASPYAQLAVGGGQLLALSTPAAIPSAMVEVDAALHGIVQVGFRSSAKGSPVVVNVTAGNLTASGQTPVGAVAMGSSIQPASVHVPQAPGPLRGKFGLLLIAFLALAAVAVLVYALLSLQGGGRSSLEVALSPYTEGGAAAGAGESQSLLSLGFMGRAVETTGRFADKQGLLERVEGLLEQADIALRPAEALFLYLAGSLLLIVATVALKGLFIGLFVLLLVVLAPPATVSFLAKNRLRRFNAQLPDTLQLLASSLRAGFWFLQGVEAVARESRKPMGDELRRVMIEAQLGRPVETALEDCATRMHSADFDWAVLAVKIQREVGGNLAELLQTVSETMVERERLRRDVKSLTAKGRVSCYMLGIMPPALGAIFEVTNPKYMSVLFTHIGGQIALGVCTVVGIAGFIWMNKIVNIEV